MYASSSISLYRQGQSLETLKPAQLSVYFQTTLPSDLTSLIVFIAPPLVQSGTYNQRRVLACVLSFPNAECT